jgi:oxygen-independent coproporphyrinogen-3 oxidase
VSIQLTPDLIRTLDVAGPRYTSYPTAPEWSDSYTSADYGRALAAFSPDHTSLSLYVHIPFCAKMCFYCGCNVVIRKTRGDAGDDYIDHLILEMDLIRARFPKNPLVKQLHWGGGTPNFLSSDQMTRLKYEIEQRFELDSTGEIAIEVDPRTVTQGQIVTLRRIGFNRISMGIQDFSETVQVAINRVQPYEDVHVLMGWIRDAGFESVNMDLIYGLPHQTPANFSDTISRIIQLSPDRIALYSYAHVPWLKSHQKLIDLAALPSQEDKLSIFVSARDHLLANGYDAIGMDHFAKSGDELAVAYKNGVLHRNFMGYTVKPADEYIGIGVSSIGFISGHFVQTTKELKGYYSDLEQGRFAIDRGLELSEDDRIRQWVIQSVMCRFGVDKSIFKTQFGLDFDLYFKDEMAHLGHCQQQGLVTLNAGSIGVTDLGKLFVRNIAMGFDFYLKKNTERRFSRTV